MTVVAAATATLVAVLLGLAVAPAAASASASHAVGSSVSTATPQPPPVRVAPPPSARPVVPTPTPSGGTVAAPTVADPGDVTSSTARFHGTGVPGHRVRVGGPASTGSAGCTAVVSASGGWSCFATLRSGPQQVFTVHDVTDPALPPSSAPAADVIVPPTVTGDRVTSGTVAGTGFPGSDVTVSVTGSSVQATGVVGSDGRWVVALPAGSDSRLTVTATQTASTARGYRSDLRSASSAPVVLTVDRSAPAAPRITSPGTGERVGTRATTVRGTGEPGAGVTVYVDRAPVCRTDVGPDGSWSCSTAGSTLHQGVHDLTATQHDAAGNYSRSSTAVRILVAGAAGLPTGPSGTTDDPTSGASTPTDGEQHGTPGASSRPTDTAGTPGPGRPTSPGGTGTPGSTGSAGGVGAVSGGGTGGPGGAVTGGRPDWTGTAGDWTATTTYDRTVPPIQAVFSWRTVLVATAVAAGFLLLVAAPLALAAGVARGRIRSPFAGLLGRNRARSDRSRADDVLPTRASIAIAVAVASLVALLGVGVSLEARYVRLAVAVLLGTAVLTAAVVLVTRWAAGPEHRTVGFRVSPWLVLAALVACGVTRAADLSPALVVGMVLVPTGRPDLGTGPLRLGSGIAASARSAVWRTVALLGLAAAGWVVHSLTVSDGFWTALVSEVATTLCLGGVGAVVATVLPVAGSAGSALLATSRTGYAALAVVAVALTAAVYSGTGGTPVPPVLLATAAAACVAAAIVAVVWARTTRPDAHA
ncbi:hypothetical protein BIU97_00510 [Curtobacterium sp. MCBA15_009]|nr:hypothetical protein BIU92_07640 [Curtobacterium sp. MCBA15_003]OII15998.1 hypothetical protein BIU97_00510 [Curtobacterium sp. MCBA15_009]OII33399.1 hypothetical protein BIU94_14100 [Curtobacterium sp. MMLR14_006]